MTHPTHKHRRRELVDAAKSIKKRRYQLMNNSNFQLALVKFASQEGLLGKVSVPRRVSSPSPYPGSPVPADEFATARWTFGAKGKPAVLFFHGTFAPVHVGHLSALRAALAHVRTTLPQLNLAGAYFSPCHQGEAAQQLAPEHQGVTLQDRLAMLHLALPRATALTEDHLPVAVDTWECSQPEPPPLSTSVRSFARRAAAAAIRRGLGPELPVVVWVTGATGLRWSSDELDVDPSLVAVCVVVDKGEEQAEADLGRALHGGPLEARVRWVHAAGPSHASELVRRGQLPVGLSQVKAYMRERLLWHTPSTHERALARLVRRAMAVGSSNGAGGGDAGATAGPEEDDEEDVGTLAAVRLRPAVWRCFYKPPAVAAGAAEGEAPQQQSPLQQDASSLPPLPRLQSRGSRFFTELDEEREADADKAPRPAATKASAAAAQTTTRRLVVKVFGPSRLPALAAEEAAYRLLELVATREEGALALPPLVGVAPPPPAAAAATANGNGYHATESAGPAEIPASAAALVLEDATARGWLMLGEDDEAGRGEEAAGDDGEQGGGASSSSASLPQLEPVAPASPGTYAAAATVEGPSPGSPTTAAARRRALLPLPEERVLQTVRALAWLHAQHWRADAGAEEGLAAAGSTSIPPMWRAEVVAARAGRLQAALDALGEPGLDALSLSEAARAALRRMAGEPALLEALARPEVSSEDAGRWGLPDWVVGAEAGLRGLTVVHGGLSWRKLGFQMEKEGERGGVMTIGWEKACLGPGPWDVALLLASSSSSGGAAGDASSSSSSSVGGGDAEREARVLAAYHAELSKAGVEDYSLAAARQDYARARLGLAPELLGALVVAARGRGDAAGEEAAGDGWATKGLVETLEETVRQIQWM